MKILLKKIWAGSWIACKKKYWLPAKNLSKVYLLLEEQSWHWSAEIFLYLHELGKEKQKQPVLCQQIQVVAFYCVDTCGGIQNLTGQISQNLYLTNRFELKINRQKSILTQKCIFPRAKISRFFIFQYFSVRKFCKTKTK